MRQVVRDAEDVLHEPQVRGALRTESLQPADVDRPGEVAAGDEHRQCFGRVRFHVLPDACAADAEPHRVERPVRKHLPVFTRDELVAREELARELRIVRRQELRGVVDRVTAEELARGRRVVVDAPLHEMLIQPLIEGEVELGEALTERCAVGARELTQVGLDGRVDRDRAGRQDAQPRVVVRHDRRDRPPEPFDQSFVTREEERPVRRDRTADGAAELVAPEIRLVAGVEIVLRVERVVAVELERAAREPVGARLDLQVDDAAERAASPRRRAAAAHDFRRLQHEQRNAPPIEPPGEGIARRDAV